nr:TIGR03564 family F420-dependent LLM class oxidoreductase [Saccharothrix syringae]
MLPTAPAGANLVDDVVALAREAADSGLRSAWFAQLFNYDAIALAAVVGREVPDLAVGTSVVPVYGRHPLTVAAAAQTAQAATHGRFTLGLGLGAKAFVEPVYGVSHERPARHLREFLTALGEVLTTGNTDFAGETLTARTPLPASLPGASPTPVLVAAMAPRALRVAAELADGILPYLAGPRALGEHIVPALHQADRRHRVVAAVPVVVTDDVAAARAAAAEQFAFYNTIPSYQRVIGLSGVDEAADLVVIGDEDAVAAELRRYLDAGATELVATQTDLLGERDRLRTWTLLGELAKEVSE